MVTNPARVWPGGSSSGVVRTRSVMRLAVARPRDPPGTSSPLATASLSARSTAPSASASSGPRIEPQAKRSVSGGSTPDVPLRGPECGYARRLVHLPGLEDLRSLRGAARCPPGVPCRRLRAVWRPPRPRRPTHEGRGGVAGPTTGRTAPRPGAPRRRPCPARGRRPPQRAPRPVRDAASGRGARPVRSRPSSTPVAHRPAHGLRTTDWCGPRAPGRRRGPRRSESASSRSGRPSHAQSG